MIDLAYAMAPTQGGKGGGLADVFIPLLLIFAIFYFILIRPQQKRAKKQREMLDNLKKGDEVITSGGIYGTITGITDTIATIEIASNVRIKANKSSIAGLKQEEIKKGESQNK